MRPARSSRGNGIWRLRWSCGVRSDYIGANHEFAAYEPDVHQVEVMFSCSVDRSEVPGGPTEIDEWQVSVDWVRIEDLADLRIFPKALAEFLVASDRTGLPGARYLGDVN